VQESWRTKDTLISWCLEAICNNITSMSWTSWILTILCQSKYTSDQQVSKGQVVLNLVQTFREHFVLQR
jgi:hypothetical protein